ncbi:Uncharacterised protein [Segatella copri]|nr:Uncharacterised protein [Segatella copri]
MSSSGLLIPIFLAVSMMRLMPISCPNLTATELILLAKALFNGILSPENEPLAVEPGWRSAVTLSYFQWSKSISPTHAFTAPVCDSMATKAQCMKVVIYLMESSDVIFIVMLPLS